MLQIRYNHSFFVSNVPFWGNWFINNELCIANMKCALLRPTQCKVQSHTFFSFLFFVESIVVDIDVDNDNDLSAFNSGQVNETIESIVSNNACATVVTPQLQILSEKRNGTFNELIGVPEV